jgi:hypothetical protein
MYDLGKTFVATQGMPSDGVIGDLWVTYEIELKKPLVASPVVTNPPGVALKFELGLSATNFFNATTVIPVRGNTQDYVFSGRVIVFPRVAFVRSYVVYFSLTATTTFGGPTSILDGFPTYSTGVTAFVYNGDSSARGLTVTGTATNTLFYQCGVTVDPSSPTRTLTLPAATLSGSVVYSEIQIYEIN